MGKSGDPSKQPRPDGRQSPQQASADVVATFPPEMSLVVTEVEASLVPFAFQGGKAIDLTLYAGPLKVHCHFPPAVAQPIIDAIEAKAREAESDLVPANWEDVQRLAKANGDKQ